MRFLLYDSDSMSLRKYHFLPLFTIALATLRAMLILVGGELRKEVSLIMLGYFVNLVLFG